MAVDNGRNLAAEEGQKRLCDLWVDGLGNIRTKKNAILKTVGWDWRKKEAGLLSYYRDLERLYNEVDEYTAEWLRNSFFSSQQTKGERNV